MATITRTARTHCNCESSACAHGAGSCQSAVDDQSARMDYVGRICAGCAAVPEHAPYLLISAEPDAPHRMTAQDAEQDYVELGDLICGAAMLTRATCAVKDADDLRVYEAAVAYRTALDVAQTAARALAEVL